MAENKEKLELNDEELQQVSGGSVIKAHWEFYGWVGQYDGVIGEEYYLVCDYKDAFVYGKLLDSWEKHGFLWTTDRYHKMDVYSSGGDCFDHGEHEYDGLNWSFYKYRRKA